MNETRWRTALAVDPDDKDAPQVLRDDGITRLVRIKRPSRSQAPRLVKTVSGKASDIKQVCLYRDHALVNKYELSCALPFEALKADGDQAILIFRDPGGRPASDPKNKPLDIAQWTETAMAMVRALAEVHRAGLLHRDIALDTFLLAAEKLYIMDFSHAREAVREFTDIEPLAADPRRLRYMAPEASGRFNRPVDYRADYYSLGVVLYELLTGRPPFQAEDSQELIYRHMTATPVPPQQRASEIPETAARIVLRLLAKEPDQRYQHPDELLEHLQVAAFPVKSALENIPLRKKTAATRAALDTPVRIYGREADRRILLERLELACAHQPQLVLIGGASGIGKTALIRETYLPVTRHRAFFVAGKFDQVQQGNPYSAWSSAMDRLVQFLLAEPPEALVSWRARFTEALGASADVLTPLIPSLPRLMGRQSAPPAMPPSEARERLYEGWARFLQVFHECERPVVVFLDDLQWIDSASLELLERVIQRPDPLPLLLIGAYRDNEVARTHPLMVTLHAVRERLTFSLTRIRLDPLNQTDTVQLLAEAMYRPVGEVGSLATEVRQRTGGNPFFIWQFLRTLCEHGSITFDSARHHWEWDLHAIREADYPDEIVELMLQRFHALPAQTRRLLAWAACLGGRFDLFLLSALADIAPVQGHRRLRPALDQEFIVPIGDAQVVGKEVLATRYAFFHDRMQEAAYHAIAPEERAPLHYRIVGLLRQSWNESEREDGILEIASHLNRARELLISDHERIDLAQVNLEAARRAKASGAFTAAAQYLRTGMTALPEDIWARAPDLAFELYRERGELEYLNSEFDTAEEFVRVAIEHVDDAYRQADLYHMLVVQYTLRADYGKAIATARLGLALFGELLPDQSYEQARDAELFRVQTLLGGNSLEALAGLAPMKNAQARAVMQLLAAVGPPCYRSHPRLWSVIVARQMRLCLEHGSVCEGTYCYPAFGGLLTHVERGDGADCKALYNATSALMKTCDDPAAVPVGYLMMASSLRHWFSPIAMASHDYLAAYRAGQASGNLQYAAYGFGHNTYCRYFQGTPLDELIPEALGYLRYSEQRQNQWGMDLITGALRVFELLHGDWNEQAWAHQGDDEEAFLARCDKHANVQVLCIYHIMRASALLLRGDAEAAAQSLMEAESRLASVSVQGLLPTTQFYILKALAAADQPRYFHMDAPGVTRYLSETVQRYEDWQRHAPSNFGYWHELALAERARHLGDPVSVSRAYERALRAAQEQRCWPAAALIARRAEQYWHQQGLDTFARIYREQADTALRQGRAWRVLGGDEGGPAQPAGPALFGQMGAAISIAQTLARHTEREQLIPDIVQLAAQHTQADRIALLLLHDGDLRLAMEVNRERSHYHPQQAPSDRSDTLPHAVLQHVSSTGRTLRFDTHEISGTPLLSQDAYWRRGDGGGRADGFWCVPIQYPGRRMGVLYLELSQGAYGGNISLTEFLAAQAAICLRNVELMHELHEQAQARREAELRASRADTEIAVRRGSERRLKQLAETDELTQLANRRRFFEHLQQAWTTAPPSGDRVSAMMLLMIDIDHFKRINDYHGHAAGDAVLIHLADLFRGETRAPDMAARMGGEEFALLLHNVASEQAQTVAQRLCQRVRDTPAQYGDQQIAFTISIGLASRNPKDTHCENLVHRADAALYRAKTEGRDRLSW